jgi:acyl dehydratase
MTETGSTRVELSEMTSLVGKRFPPSPWRTVEQSMIDAFAEATGDFQWIHVDAERAADGPFGSTVAHGYLTLSLLPRLIQGQLEVDGSRMTLNYGVNRCRFPTPVRAGARIRGHARIAEVHPRAAGSMQLLRDVTAELEGSDKPACVAQIVTLYVP